MAAEAATPSWRYANSEFSFAQNAPTHIPRGWERAPQRSHLARHKGRKVWKRPEIRAKEDTEKLEAPTLDEQRNPLRDVSTNTPRPVKRLRVKDGIARGEPSEGGGFANYFTTLRDGAVETPKRKRTSRKIAKLEEASREMEKIEEATQQVEIPEQVNSMEAKEEIEEDVVHPMKSAAQTGVRDLLESRDTPAVKVEAEKNAVLHDASRLEEEGIKFAGLADSASNQAPRDLEEEVIPEAKMDTPKFDQSVREMILLPKVTAERDAEADSVDAAISAAELDLKMPMPQARKNGPTLTPRASIESPQGQNSPQIGTTLLRRESLRSKGSPRKKGSAQKSKTPQRRHGLKKRDTLQEREILQQFNATASPHQATGTESLVNTDGDASPSKHSLGQSIVAKAGQPIEATSEFFKDGSPPEVVADTQTGDVASGKKTLDSKDPARAVEAIEVCQNSNEDEINAAFSDASPSLEAKSTIDQTNDFISKSGVQRAPQAIAEFYEIPDLSTKKTRSGARISDDTSMLKDFLNRAQAAKAAKNVPPLSAEIPKLQGSPIRRSPRKALEPHIGNFLSPQKSKKGIKGPSTPPRKAAVEETDSSDDEETVNEPTSFRRSTRTRLPAPSKTPPGAPSFIPVRRGDGSDQVVLQKSQAQEMAIVTRANTRRNKGQSKPPALALQDLPAESPVKMTGKERAEHTKKVAWAEKLASYQESQDAPEEPEEQRPKVRRMRGLGAVNGTPAKKTTAAVPSSNGTPAPKRRSKTK